MLRDRFGHIPDPEPASTPFAERLTATLAVELGRDSWLRKDVSPEMAIAFTGDIDVELRPGEEPDLQGSVEPIAGRGFVEQFGRRFDVREGTVTFDGPPSAVRLDLSAEYAIPSHDNPDASEATIVLDIDGTRDSLSLSLSSEPPMENADIVSYIATGRPASGSLSVGEGDGDGGLVDAGAGLAVGQIVGAIEGAAAQGIGLDVMEIRREGLRQATVVAGKYVSPRVYIGYARPVTLQEGDGSALEDEGESEVEVELEALRWLLINIEGSGSALRFFLRGRYAY
jgi:translocation and assembly module TamB